MHPVKNGGITDRLPAEAEASFQAALETETMAAQLTEISLRQERRGQRQLFRISCSPSLLDGGGQPEILHDENIKSVPNAPDVILSSPAIHITVTHHMILFQRGWGSAGYGVVGQIVRFRCGCV